MGFACILNASGRHLTSTDPQQQIVRSWPMTRRFSRFKLQPSSKTPCEAIRVPWAHGALRAAVPVHPMLHSLALLPISCAQPWMPPSSGSPSRSSNWSQASGCRMNAALPPDSAFHPTRSRNSRDSLSPAAQMSMVRRNPIPLPATTQSTCPTSATTTS